MPDLGYSPARLALAALAVGVAAYLYTLRERYTVEAAVPVTSSVDQLPYRIQPAHDNPTAAADTLARLNRRSTDLLRALKRRWRGADPNDPRTAAVGRLLARYNPDNLAENSPADPTRDTSYTVGKGSLVALCLRERGGAADLHALDVLTFVTYHELGHIALDEVNHPPIFWRAFRWLLEEAEAAGIYRSPDFAAQPERYCGILVNYSPVYDPKVRPLGDEYGPAPAV